MSDTDTNNDAEFVRITWLPSILAAHNDTDRWRAAYFRGVQDGVLGRPTQELKQREDLLPAYAYGWSRGREWYWINRSQARRQR